MCDMYINNTYIRNTRVGTHYYWNTPSLVPGCAKAERGVVTSSPPTNPENLAPRFGRGDRRMGALTVVWQAFSS